jgi:hypothetical protein
MVYSQYITANARSEIRNGYHNIIQQNARKCGKGMNNKLVGLTGMVDRFLLSLGIYLTIFFVILKFVGKIEWEWKWILSPLWICLILTFLRLNYKKYLIMIKKRLLP